MSLTFVLGAANSVTTPRMLLRGVSKLRIVGPSVLPGPVFPSMQWMGKFFYFLFIWYYKYKIYLLTFFFFVANGLGEKGAALIIEDHNLD